jgi:hypothetical protein
VYADRQPAMFTRKHTKVRSLMSRHRTNSPFASNVSSHPHARGKVSLKATKGPHVNTSALAFALLTIVSIAPAQPQPSPAPAPTLTQTQETPPQLILGQRLEKLREVTTYVNSVVIVSDADSYLAALSTWTPTRRFPILIDDGSPRSRDDISRFVRGFQPRQVVRFTAPDSKSAPGEGGFVGLTKARVQSVMDSVWNPGKATTLKAAFDAAKHRPPGIVIAHRDDPAWTAGLALAAAWGQPIELIETKPEGNIDWSLTVDRADELEKTVAAVAADTGFSYNRLGDDLDSITLCLNAPERIKTTGPSGEEFLALSDRIGREGTGTRMTARWAWCGHIFGNAATSAYAAMSSLFLHPRRAYVFDGYEETVPWNYYDGTKAGEILSKYGIKCEVDDAPSQGADAWRARASKPLTADLIFVNTKGNSDFFDLRPGQCKPGDLPILVRPAALHFVHSWSLLFPGKRESVGGRWFERGVFAYTGSVHEPTLQAFTPTPNVAGRLVSGAPFAPAIRIENQPVWKIAVLGDPLYAPGPPVPRTDEALPGVLAECKSIDENLKELLTKEDWSGGLLAMKLSGRDADISKLVDVLVQTKPDGVTPAILREGVLASFYAGQIQVLTALYARLPPTFAADGLMRDCLWLSAGEVLVERPATKPTLTPEQTAALLRLLRENVRTDQVQSDATRLAGAWSRQFGPGSTIELFTALRKSLPSAEHSKALDAAQGR